ncbi:MAG TPA: YqaE/Pmp3 family membrane protein [Flavisolibacter sp.]|nr:YqaE/Pmp3 family membrane protein [Flavisolibacter sp.]
MKRFFTRLLGTLVLIAILCPAQAVVAPASSHPAPPDALTVNAALKSFGDLSKKEKKAKFKEVKKAIKAHKASKGSAQAVTNTLLLVIIAILLPPLAVFLHQGEINSRFWISLLLTLLFYLPGLIYALVVILGDKRG